MSYNNEVSSTWKSRDEYVWDSGPITIITTLFDGRMTSVPHSVGIYDESWVDKLYRGIERHYTKPFRFVCLTDKNYTFSEPIIQERLSMSVDNYGWLCLIDMYRPELCSGRRFTIGLDTILTGTLDEILAHETKIGLCTDPFTPQWVCNAVTIANAEFCNEYWDLWSDKNKEMLANSRFFGAPSEMAVLRQYYNDVERLDVTFPGQILSYKANVVGVGKQNYMHPTQLQLDGSSIVYFHGDPKPNTITHQKWVQENWV